MLKLIIRADGRFVEARMTYGRYYRDTVIVARYPRLTGIALDD